MTIGRKIAASFLVALFAGAALGAQDQELSRGGTFEGRWELFGKAERIELGDKRRVTIAKIQGAVNLDGSGGLSRGFRTECVGLQDEKTGGFGRCVWKDRFDDEIWSEISSDSVSSARDSKGVFVGGTGKFEGMEGEFEFKWVFMVPASGEGNVQGYTTELTGVWRLP